MSDVKAVFFDAAGTLFHVHGSVAEIYLRYAEPYGVKRSPEMLRAIADAFRRAFQDAPPPVFAATDPGEIKRCERLWWFDIVHHVFYRIGMFEGFDDYFDEVFQAFDGPALWRLYPETLTVLKSLKGSGFELGIVSNFDSRLFNVLRGLGLIDLFETVTIASLARAAKPAPRIFQLALDKHALDANEAVHVGDSVRDDIAGGRAAGLTTVLLDREGADRSAHDGIGAVIRSLDELPDLLSSL